MAPRDFSKDVFVRTEKGLSAGNDHASSIDYEYDYEHEHEHEHEYWRLGQILLDQINPTQVIDT